MIIKEKPVALTVEDKNAIYVDPTGVVMVVGEFCMCDSLEGHSYVCDGQHWLEYHWVPIEEVSQ